MKSENEDVHMEVENYIQLFESLPCGAYIIKDDPDFTLIYGNPIFYELFGCNEERMRHKYGNRFGALINSKDQDTLRHFLDKDKLEESVWLELKLTTNDGRTVWVHSGVSVFSLKGERVLCCFCADITKVKNAEDELSRAQSILQFVVTRRKGEIIEYNLKNKSARIIISGDLSKLAGYEQNQIVPRFAEKILEMNLMDEDSAVKFKNLFYGINKNRESSFVDVQVGLDHMRWMRVLISPITDTVNGDEYAIASIEDITQEKQTFFNYLSETQNYQALLTEKVAYAHIDVTGDKITKIGGMWNLYNEVIDKITYTELFDSFIDKVVHPDDRQMYKDVMQCDNYIQSLERGINQLGCEFRRIVEQNKMAWMEIKIHLFKDTFSGRVMALLALEDIDARKKNEVIEITNGERDQLTNTYSKEMIESFVREYMTIMDEEEVCAYVFLDVDDFKKTNDKYGYKIGDTILQGVAKILGSSFRKQDYIGRFGSDSFVLFIKDIVSAEIAVERLGVFYRQLESNKNINVTCSMGITIVQGYKSYETILKEAMVGLCTAKKTNRGSYIFYNNKQSQYEEEANHLLNEKAREEPINPLKVINQNKSTDSFDTFIGEQGDMAYLVNPQTYEVIIGNKAFYDRIGRTLSEISGCKCYELMQNRNSPCPFCSRANWSTDKYYLWRNLSRALEQEFLMKNKLIQWNDQKVLLAIAIDISNDKSIVDSMENSATEAHNVLSGIEKMTAAQNLRGAIEIALETIGFFYVADSVEFWEWSNEEKQYNQIYGWQVSNWEITPKEIKKAVNSWLQSKCIDTSVVVENRESMLSCCYDMYELMQMHDIFNQRWIPFYDETEIIGYIAIHNISANFQNLSFLNSFLVFMANERKNRIMLERILHNANHDALTGLLNRSSYDDYIHNFVSDNVDAMAVIMGDVNSLKEVNRIQGYHTGDNYIKRFANLLQSTFSENPVFRLNGDEFMVLAENMGQQEIEQKIKVIKKTVEDDNLFTVTLGFAWDNIEKNLDELVETATQVVKVNKERYYDGASDIENVNRHRMLQELIHDVEVGNYKVFLQPKIDFKTEKYSGAEALIRYETEKTGFLSPAKFIPLLEENNFIRYIDVFVFEEICRLLERWKKEGRECPIISVNFSRLTLLEADIVETVEGIINKYEVERNKIEIEITESSGEIGKGALFQTIKKLYHEGFSISLDDFGTKYTNLSILSDVDFHVLKLDRSLIDVLDKRERDRIVIKNVISMCREMGIIVIAEGIETHEQEAVLKSMGCDWGQGYLYGKPTAITEYEKIYLG